MVACKHPGSLRGLSTSWMGLFERFNVYGYMVWVAVFAVILLRARSASRTEHPSGETV